MGDGTDTIRGKRSTKRDTRTEDKKELRNIRGKRERIRLEEKRGRGEEKLGTGRGGARKDARSEI